MSQPPHNPDSTPRVGPDAVYDPGPLRIEGMPEILQIEKLDELVGIYDEMLAAPKFATDSGPDTTRIEEKIAEAKKTLLRNAGFVVEEDGRTDEQAEAYAFADRVLDRAIRSNKSDWIGVTTPEGTHDGPRNQVIEELLARYHHIQSPSPEDEVDDSETEITPEELEQLRNAKREAFVARMKGPVYDKKKKQELDDAYKEAEQAYMGALTEQNKKNIEEKQAALIARGVTGPELIKELKEYAKTMAERIQEQEFQSQHDLFVKESGPLGKMMEKYADLSWKGKLGYGALIAAGTIVVGFGLGALTGLIGGAVGVAGLTMGSGAVMRVWGAAKTYQLRKVELYRSPTTVPKFELGDGDDTDTMHVQQQAYLEKNARDQIEQGDKIKKKAVKWAIGTVALGALSTGAGIAMHVAADGGSWDHVWGGGTQHVLEQPLNHGTTTTSGNMENPFEAHGIPDKSQIQIKLPPEAAPPEAPGPEVVPSPPVTTELWNGAPTERVLQKLYSGLSERDSYLDINKLYDKFGPNGVFSDTGGNPIRLSEHSPNNIWIMQRSGTVELTPQAQAYLDQLHGHTTGGASAVETAAKLSGNVTPTGATGTNAAEVASNLGANVTPNGATSSNVAEALSNLGNTDNLGGSGTSQALESIINQGNASPVNIVSPSEGWYQTFTELRSAGVVDIPNGQYGSFLRQVGPELAKLKYDNGTPVAYFDRFHHEWRMYSPPIGRRLPPAALRVITRFAARDNYTLAA